MKLTAQDSKPTNGKDQAKPAPEHDAIKKIAEGAVSEFHKLLDEVYGKPADKTKPPAKPGEPAAKPATKPATEAHPKDATPVVAKSTPAVAEKPHASVPVAEKPATTPTKPAESSHGLWNWISTGEKAAENALSIARNYVQQEARSLLSSSESSKSPNNTTEKPADAKPETTSTPASSPASSPDSAATTAKPDTGLLDSVTETAKAAASSFSGSATEKALLMAASALVPGVGTVVAAAAASDALPALVGYGGLALQGFKHTFGFDGTDGMQRFDKVAEHVQTLDVLPDYKAPTAVEETADRQYVMAAAKEAGISWMFAGQNKPGGESTIIGRDGKVEASGTTASGDKVKVTSTLEQQMVQAGLTTVTHDAKGITVHGSTYEWTKDGDTWVADLKTSDGSKLWARLDPKKGYAVFTGERIHGSIRVYPDGSMQQVIGNDGFNQVKGPISAADKAGQEHPLAHGVQYYIDAQGNMGAVTSDNVKYQFYKKEHKLLVTKGDKVMQLNTESGEALLFAKDAKTGALTRIKITKENMAPGWVLNADGSVNINGAVLQDKDTKQINIGDKAVMDTKQGTIEANTTEGKTKLSQTGTDTALTTPGGISTVSHDDGSVGFNDNGKPLMEFDPKNWKLKSDTTGEELQFDRKTNTVTDREKTNQTTTMDAEGNVKSFAADHTLLFGMNNKGDIHLYDGTDINHDGSVVNAARHILEASYSALAAAASRSETAQEVVKAAAAKAESLAAMANVPGGLDASIASLEAVLAQLNRLGDVPELAEQIGAAKATVESKLAQARARESLDSKLTHAGLDSGTIEKAFAARGTGLSEDQIVNKFSKPESTASAA